jgi:hypothetical protein
MPVQSIRPELQSDEKLFTNRHEAAKDICGNETMRNLVEYGINQIHYTFSTDMEVVKATSSRNLVHEIGCLNRLRNCMTNANSMGQRGDYGGHQDNRGSSIGVANFGKKPRPNDDYSQDQFKVEVRLMDQEEARSRILGISAEKVLLQTEVAYEIDLIGSTSTLEYSHGTGKFEKYIERVANQTGVRYQIDSAGNILSICSVSVIGNTPHIAEIPYYDNVNIADLIPNIKYMAAAPEENPQQQNSKKNSR